MIWSKDISFEGFQKKIDDWYRDKYFEVADPPIDAQFALGLIFKTLVDDEENYPYLTTMSESTEQTNSIMLDLILKKYSKKYRKFVKRQRRRKKMEENRLTAEYVGQVISDTQTRHEKERECTDKIVKLAREIVNTYREYNPDGNYLNICFSGAGLMVSGVPTLRINNNYWQDPFNIQYDEEVCD